MDQLLNTEASSCRREGEFRYPGGNAHLVFLFGFEYSLKFFLNWYVVSLHKILMCRSFNCFHFLFAIL